MKKGTLLFALILAACTTFATGVSENFARQIAQKFMTANSTLTTKAGATPVHTFTSGGEARVYVFNFGDEGFVMVSADDRARPILGFSDSGSFDPDNIPSNMLFFIESEFVAAIDYAIENDIEQSTEVASEWALVEAIGRIDASKSNTAISPLLQTTWDQNCYYNEQCPAATNQYACNHVYAGCVATAMAQIMRYWEYPTTGTGQYSYVHSTYGTQSVNFAAQNYNYSQMPNSISSSNPQVAKLIYHCAVSVDMDFGVNGSGASINAAANALKTYFRYSNDLSLENKASYTDAAWVSKLKTCLNSNTPVLYSGHNSSSGHAWVCDGYNDQSLFHMNWGWSGNQNNYFALNALNTSEGNYSSQQSAVFNIIPSDLCEPPQSIIVDVFNTEVNLSWTAPEDAIMYRVYRDGIQIAAGLTETSYVDTAVSYGVHCYTIRTLCSNYIQSPMSSPVCDTVSICPKVNNLSSSTIGTDVTLSWSPVVVNNVEEWLCYGDENGTPSTLLGFGSPFYTAIRFSPSQLTDYAGARIKKLSCYDGASFSGKIAVYQGPATTSANLVGQRVLQCTGTNQWIDIPVNMELDTSKDLWIVVFLNSTGSAAPLMQVPSTSNGRLLSTDGTSWSDLANMMSTGANYTNMIRCYVSTLGGEKSLSEYNVYRDSQLIGSTTETTYQDTGLTEGQMYCYTVRARCSNGESANSEWVCVTGGVNSTDETSETKVAIYPNPTNGLVTVEAEGMNNISVFDMTGRLMTSTDTDNSAAETIDLSSLGKGMYMVRIITANGAVTRQIVIQ